MKISIPRIAIMLDLETLDTKPTALVTQIAFETRDLETNETIYKLELLPLTDRKNQPSATMDISTFQWWMSQDLELFKRLLFDQGHTEVELCRREVSSFIKNSVNSLWESALWANPANFDFPILYNMLGEQPWDHQRVRCFRSLQRTLDKDRNLAPVNTGMKHDAVDDVAWQLDYLHNIYKAASKEG